MIAPIALGLFADLPTEVLYHYTSLSGLIGIVADRELRASDIRYMNDSTELRHTVELLQAHITHRIIAGTDRPAVLNRFLDWLSHRIVSGPLLFGASFRSNGNLLSQWRGYSAHGKGVSLGFDPAHILACAARQQFQVGRCLYDPRRQEAIIEQVVDGVEKLVVAGDSAETSRVSAVAWRDTFERIEGELLRIAAVLKHPSFEEEQEWRIVSPAIFECAGRPVRFREGSSMLVPYYAFDLAVAGDSRLALEHVFLGPTSNIDLSMNSLRLFLSGQRALPRQGISYCQIPYRQR
jgi:hypothetical protein